MQFYNPLFSLGLAFDCNQDMLCGCCWCPCPGEESMYEGSDCSRAAPYTWPGEFPDAVINEVTINVFTDYFPQETIMTWEKQAEDGLWQQLASSSPSYPLSLYSYTTEVEPETFYRLSVWDRVGDGFCCSFGVGWSTVTTAVPSAEFQTGTVIWQGDGQFEAVMDALFWVDKFGLAHYVERNLNP